MSITICLMIDRGASRRWPNKAAYSVPRGWASISPLSTPPFAVDTAGHLHHWYSPIATEAPHTTLS